MYPVESESRGRVQTRMRTYGGAMVRWAGRAAERGVQIVRDARYQRMARRIVRKHVSWPRQKYDDRCVLEETIIPFVLSRFDPQRVLDIGRERYEAFYNEFFVGREVWTIDRDPLRRRFGADCHIIDDVVHLRRHFCEDYFGLVLMNGVFGWGLNCPYEIEETFDAVYDILEPGGLFVLGWNDTPDLIPVPLEQVQTLESLTPYYFQPLGGTSFRCATAGHVYSFFIREP